MSINGLLNDESFLQMLLLIFGIGGVIVFFVVIAGAKKNDKQIYGGDNDDTELFRDRVRVVARRTSPHPMTPRIMVNMIVFEKENGSRVELAIRDPAVFGTIVEGDKGILSYQGKRFVGFQRDV